MIGGELKNAVAEPDVPGALAGSREKGFRRWRVRVFFQEMMFHHPGMVVAEPVGGLQLRQRILIKLELVTRLPRTRQLQLVEDAELHDVSPAGPALFVETSLFPANRESNWRTFHIAESDLHGQPEWLALQLRLSRLGPPNEPHDKLHATSGFRVKGRCRLAESQARAERHAARVSPVRLCRHRQDHAGAAYRGRRRWRGEIRRLHRQGRARHA